MAFRCRSESLDIIFSFFQFYPWQFLLQWFILKINPSDQRVACFLWVALLPAKRLGPINKTWLKSGQALAWLATVIPSSVAAGAKGRIFRRVAYAKMWSVLWKIRDENLCGGQRIQAIIEYWRVVFSAPKVPQVLREVSVIKKDHGGFEIITSNFRQFRKFVCDVSKSPFLLLWIAVQYSESARIERELHWHSDQVPLPTSEELPFPSECHVPGFWGKAVISFFFTLETDLETD